MDSEHDARSHPPPEGAVEDAVRAAVDAGLAQARVRWPNVVVDADRLAACLRTQPAATLRAACVRDLVLACGCLAGDAAAIAALERDVLARVAARLSRLLPSRPDRDELLQTLRMKLLVGDGRRPPALAGYVGRGHLRGLCTLMATRMALNRTRDRRREVLVNGADIQDSRPSADPELSAVKSDHRADVERVVRVALRALSTRERNLLRQSHVDGLTIDELGAVYSVHRATAARWLVRAREAVKAEARRLLVEEGIADREVDSLLRVLTSQLEISLGGLAPAVGAHA